MERGRVARTRVWRKRPTSGVTCRSRSARGVPCSRSRASRRSSSSRTARARASIIGLAVGLGRGPARAPSVSIGGDGGNRTHDRGFADPCLNHLATSPLRYWCRGGDLNPYALSGTAPSRRRVYLFHHLGDPLYITDFRPLCNRHRGGLPLTSELAQN